MKNKECYQGLETGPIRPPSEAGSLMLKVTRNCPWNQCKFCGLYKGKKFSIRPVDHVKQDINMLRKHVDRIKAVMEPQDAVTANLKAVFDGVNKEEQASFHSALNWYREGMESVFLQDANTLIIKPDDLVEILTHLKHLFPQIQRITSYARSHTRLSKIDSSIISIYYIN